MDMERFLDQKVDDEAMPITAELRSDLEAAYRQGNVADSFAALASAVQALDDRGSMTLVRAVADRGPTEGFPIYSELQDDLDSALSFGSSDVQGVIVALTSAVMSLEMAAGNTRRDLGLLISELRQAGLDVSELED